MNYGNGSMVNLCNVVDEQLVILTKFLIDNPGMNQEKQYDFHKIIPLPSTFKIDSGLLFAIMSSAFSLDQKTREVFFDKHPKTREYLSTLGPNRQQYGMLLFDFLSKINRLVMQIIQNYIEEMEDKAEIFEIYQQQENLTYKKGIFFGSPKWIQAKIILTDPDPRIRNLRY